MSEPTATESKILEKPVDAPVAEQAEKPAATKGPAKTSFLKKYFSQAAPATEEERKRQAEVHPKDCNSFTIRAFLHDNVSQAIPREAPPRPVRKVESSAESATPANPAEPAEPAKPLTQKIKEAFTGGEKQTAPAKSEKDSKVESAEEEVKMEEPAVEEPDVQGPGK
jgi:hypothetical protein